MLIIKKFSPKIFKKFQRLLNEARIKQHGLNEMFHLIDQGQNKLNASFQLAKQTIDDTFSFIVQAVHEAQKGLYTELEGIYGYKQVKINFIEYIFN